ncbi:uncharacterized protein PV09_08954 [Verruconis gallopava]|uniref:Zn(2)-C6 fungal-type domain-containing protein n=1 Tax=Verruconis gallopava TaxID=253628 RepID=A0A0D1YF87_9PEZI|nr:uncharacterized protein PV09_08954 [Verruconis gallopava]KIV99416.1 hypothetical protein PV09_08954 [Verruconis gallopava]
MAGTDKPATKRKHITTACLSCRESKVKCDGAVPACSSCINKSKSCRYLAGDDRRKLSMRVAIELLSTRVEQLTQILIQNGIQVPRIANHEKDSLQKVLTTLGMSHKKIFGDCSLKSSMHESNEFSLEKGNIQEPVAPPEDGQLAYTNTNEQIFSGSVIQVTQNESPTQTDLMTRFDAAPTGMDVSEPQIDAFGQPGGGYAPREPAYSSPERTWGTAGELLSQPDMEHSPDRRYCPLDQTNSNVGGSTFGEPVTQHSQSIDEEDNTESIEELVDKLSDRIGTLHVGEDGQIRYYGPTSNYALMSMPSADPMHVHRSIRNDGQEYLDRLDVGAEPPAELENHLINLYFAWQDPFFHVVDRDIYEQAKRKWYEEQKDTPYYSEALRNAMCSLGAAFEAQHHPDFVTFPKSLADFFADRAKALLEIELDAPCIATAQAIVVTSCHDMGCTRDARGWLYSGMAIRLAFDLALHKDMSAYVATGVMTQAEANLRSTVFWGIWIVDQVWSFHLGRQFKINMDDVSCGKPYQTCTRKAVTGWSPYTGNGPVPGISFADDLVDEVARQRVALCEIMGPRGQNLYGGDGITPHRLQELNMKTVTALFEWRNNLPDSLKVNLDNELTPYVPHLLLLHMHYYQCLIHAHRPWMSRNYIQSQPPQGPGSDHARLMCVDAAISIARILRIYEKQFTFRRINIQGPIITCSAALILIFADISHYGKSHDLKITPHLSLCFRALDAFGQCWENAKRARVFLTKLQRQWEVQARMKRTTKRHRAVTGESRKRPLTATDFDTDMGDGQNKWQGQNLEHTLFTQMPQLPLQNKGDFLSMSLGDLNFDWIFDAKVQAVSGNWAGGSYPD